MTLAKIVTCPYCKNPAEEATKNVEHVIPEGLGSPILNPAVCGVCNEKASIHIDGRYFNNVAVNILKAATNTYGKNGRKEFIVGTDFHFNIKLIVKKAELALDTAVKEELLRKLYRRHGNSGFQVIKANLKEEICKREHAKMFLGILSMCVPNFTLSKTADHLRILMWKKDRPELDLPSGSPINGNLLGEVNQNYSLQDGQKIYDNRHHYIAVKGEKDGTLNSYIDLYNTLRPTLSTTEQNEEWKGIEILIMIDPELKQVVKHSGIHLKEINKYRNGVTLE
jgi:RNA polymerase subunit RPABC4/transcription elongation factor Spt4